MALRSFALRLLGVGLGLPTLLVVSDELLLSTAEATDGSQGVWASFFIWLVTQTALMSFAAGRWLPNWPWRLLVLAWTLLSLNILLFHAAAVGSGYWPLDSGVLAYAFLTAQFSLLAAWLVLGATPWQWRLPSVAIAILPAGFAIIELRRMGIAHGNLWNEVAAMQVFTTFVFALALRFRGFRVRSIDTNRSVDSISGNSAPMQFSLAQILFWTAAIAPFLIAIKGLDYAFPRRLGWWHWWAVMAKGALLAPTVLVALWAALGNGQVRLKVFGLVLVGVATGLALVVVDRFLGTSRAGLGYGSADYYLSRVSRSTDAFLGWVAWTELAGFLLAGMLLVFRGTSYRLLRQGRPRLRKVP